MNFRFCESLQDSLAVLNKLRDLSRDVELHSCYVNAYQNGREQGFSIVIDQYEPELRVTAISWAHHRNSDRMRVYEGPYSLQAISDDAFENDHIFDTVDECAEYIWERVQDIQRTTNSPTKEGE